MTCAGKAAQADHQFDVRRMTGLETAAEMIGQQALGAALGVDPRAIRAKIKAERGVSARDLDLAATALEVEAARMLVHAAKMRSLYGVVKVANGGAPSCEPMIAGADGWCEWLHPLPGFLMQCCDCGLTHDAEFAIAGRIGDGPLNAGESDEAVVIFRMRRHAPAAVQP